MGGRSELRDLDSVYTHNKQRASHLIQISDSSAEMSAALAHGPDPPPRCTANRNPAQIGPKPACYTPSITHSIEGRVAKLIKFVWPTDADPRTTDFPEVIFGTGRDFRWRPQRRGLHRGSLLPIGLLFELE